ncbi:MAG: sensor diguanylate cyclase [Herbaspirillum sp.]|nr:sensor diguanylate cyclase [Herbaspirillum sp.]
MRKNVIWPQLRLSSWIAIGALAAVLATTLSLLAVVDRFARNHARDEAENRLRQLAGRVRDELDEGMRERMHGIKDLARRAIVRHGADPAALRTLLNQTQNESMDYAWIGVTDPGGTVIAGTRAMLEGRNTAERPWFVAGSKALYLGDYRPAPPGSPPLQHAREWWGFVDVALPIFDEQGVYRGVLGAHLSWNSARSIATALLQASENHDHTDILVVRDDNVVLFGPDRLEEQKIGSASLSLARSGKAGALVEKWEDDTPYITAYVRTGLRVGGGGLNWSILARQPQRLAMADFRRLEEQLLIAGGLIALLLALGSMLIARRLAAPLDALTTAIEMRNVDGGEDRLPEVQSYSEISRLSSALTAMLGRERRYRTEAATLNENLESHVAERTRQLKQTATALRQALDVQQDGKLLLQESENELRAILQNASDAFIAIDENSLIIEWNRQAELLFGWRRDEAIGQLMHNLIVPEASRENHLQGMCRFLESRKGALINKRIELNALRRDGSELPVELVIGYVERRAGPMFIAFLHDITERQSLRSSLESLAFIDMLTGLLNRRAFAQKLPEAMADAVRRDEMIALLFLDIDGFKEINDTYGHEAGDEMLCMLAARVRHEVRNIDTVARLAGDEFTIILENLSCKSEAADVAEKILLALRQPFGLTAATVSVSVSIGVATFEGGDTTTPDGLMSRADAAMYVAKRAGKNRVHSD